MKEAKELIVVFILDLFGLSLIPALQTAVNSTLTAVGATSISGVLVGLVPFLMVAVIIFLNLKYIQSE
jgi:hypothetical protein